MFLALQRLRQMANSCLFQRDSALEILVHVHLCVPPDVHVTSHALVYHPPATHRLHHKGPMDHQELVGSRNMPSIPAVSVKVPNRPERMSCQTIMLRKRSIISRENIATLRIAHENSLQSSYLKQALVFRSQGCASIDATLVCSIDVIMMFQKGRPCEGLAFIFRSLGIA